MDETKIWKKILWAVDPFSEEKTLQASAALAIQTLIKSEETPIEPIYILNQSPLGIPITLSPEIVAQTCTSAQDELDEIVSSVQLKNLQPLKVLVNPYKNQKELAEELISYAKQTEADLIVASTHGKSGIKRWFTGSFVENLMLYSDVPLFTVNPFWKPETQFKHIVFPTDFSEESVSAFNQVMHLAHTLNLDIVVFHQILNLINPYVEAPFPAYSIYKETLEEELAEKQKKANRLADVARERGIRAKAYINYHLKNSVAESILNYARKKHCIVAMTANSGKLSASLLGSTTRKVVRGSIYPVWVIHPHFQGKAITQETKAA